jgi:peptide/nickel transport system substrate-binding protein
LGRRENVVVVTTVIVVLTVAFGLTYVYTGPDPVPEDIFIFETIGNPDSMDPHVNYESFGGTIHFNVYETLYTYPWGSNNTEPSVPLLASGSPVISADGTQYNITLREDVTFHDGTPFNASCVKWNFERATKQFDTHGPVWMIVEPLRGGEVVELEAYRNGTSSPEFRAAFDDWQENSGAIVVLDTYTIQFNLEYPFAPFIATMTYQVGSIMSPSYVLSNPSNDPGAMHSHWGADYGEVHTWMENHTCGTGPYMLEEWKPNEFVKMVIYEDYWRANATEAAIEPPDYAGTLEEIYYNTNEDTTERLSNLRTGLADSVYWPTFLADEIWDNVTLGSKNPNIDVIVGGISYTLMALTFNFNPGNITRGGVRKEVQSPFSYHELRKCFAYAFDYDAAINRIVRGWGIQAKGFLPQGMFGHDSSYWHEECDIDQAVAWWNAAMNMPGFVDTINDMEGYIDLYYNSGNLIRQQGSLLLKDGFSAVMNHTSVNLNGISPVPEVRVSALSWANMWEWPDYFLIWLIGWAPDYADPHNYAWPFVHSNGTFMKESGYGNDTVDEWIVNASKSTDPAERLEIYGRIQEQVAYDQPCIYMYQPREFTVRRAWLRGTGLEFNPMHGYYWYHIYKDYDPEVD